MPLGRPGGPHGDSDDELLAEFKQIPTVQKIESMEDPDETRTALLALANQGIAAGAAPEEVAEVLRSVKPGTWGNAKNKNQLNQH